MKDKKGKTILTVFIERVNESNRKSNKSWVDQEGEFYNKCMQEWLNKKDLLNICDTQWRQAVNAERFIRTLRAKIFKKWQLMMGNLTLVIWIN